MLFSEEEGFPITIQVIDYFVVLSSITEDYLNHVNDQHIGILWLFQSSNLSTDLEVSFFVRTDSKSGRGWKVVGVKDACLKTTQALRDASIRTKKSKGVKDISKDISKRYFRKMKSRISLLIQESMLQTINHDNFQSSVLHKSEATAVQQDELSSVMMDGLDVVDLETAQVLLDALEACQEDDIPPTPSITHPSFNSMSSDNQPEVSSTSNELGPVQLVRSVTDIPDSKQGDDLQVFEDALIQSSLISIPIDDIIQDSPTLIEDFTLGDYLNDNRCWGSFNVKNGWME